jgi:tripeptidyl-peptidase-1
MRLQTLLFQALGFVQCYVQLASCVGLSQHVEQLDDVPDGWLKKSRPQPTKLVKFRLAITQSNAAEFEQKVIELSTPGHPSYGQYMTQDEVKDFLRPSPAISDKITAWLRSANTPANAINADGNWISFTVPISQAEQILETNFFYFHHPQQGAVIGTLGYSVPKDLHPYIQLIQPTTRFGNFGSQKSTIFQPVQASPERLAAGCDKATTPRCLRDLYGIDNTTNKQDWRNRLGISGYLEQYARYADLEEFLRHYAPNQTTANFSVVAINDGHNDQESSFDSVEANLDVQYSITLADDVLATFYTTGGRGPTVAEIDHPNPSNSTNEPYLEQLHYLLNLPDEKLPAVLSNSYGENEQSLPASYVNATCSLFAQLGARGVSIIFSSGDSGPGSACLMNDGTNRTRFLPSYPASCPFVTAVGGTHNIHPERAIYFSGGGFSDIFPRPPYQEQAVKSYFSHLGSQWKGLYNPYGRGFPDVSAQATNFVVRDHGMWMSVAGTRFVFHSPLDRSAD